MSLTQQFVSEVFEPLSTGDTEGFFKNVAEDVKWTVMGSHPLAGTYHTRETFVESTFARLAKIMSGTMSLQVEDIVVDGDTAVVLLATKSKAMNGLAFNNDYCWVCTFEDKTIVKVRAYLDSALVAQAIEENESIRPGECATAIPAFSTMPGH